MDEWMDRQTDRIRTDKLIIVLLSLRSSTAITGDTAHSVDNILTTVINIPALTTGGDMTSCKKTEIKQWSHDQTCDYRYIAT